MQESLNSAAIFGNIEKRRISVYATAAAIFWTLIIGGFIVLDVIQAKSETTNRSKSAAFTSLNKDIAFRQWVSKHGGVYVPVTKETPPNPHLSHITERDIKTSSGNALTLMNPAYALRQVMEDFIELNGIRGHITSLKPLRIENAPDEWERRALLQFEKGVREVSERTPINGEPFLRLMRPFITEKACLKCHEAQGYKEGDVRGGISVSVPMSSYLEEESARINLMAVTHGSTWAIVLIAIYLVSDRLRSHISSRMKAEDEVLIHANRNRLLLESAAEGIIGIDRNGVQIFVNSSAAGMLGYKSEELINRNSHPIWHNTNADSSDYAE